jgi:hypothetical protein
MGCIPMAAIAETDFGSAGSNVEFVVNRNGEVTHLIDHAVEGDERFDRKP